MERRSLLSWLRQPEQRHLRIRALVAIAAAVLVSLPFGWIWGITAGVLVAVAHTIIHARSGTAGPRMASAAERKTEAQLRRLERSGYRALHARAIPGSDAQIDHLVIGPTGVYAVDSEKWDRRLPVRALSHRRLYLGPFSKMPRLDEAHWEASQASQLISQEIGTEVRVVPSLAIYGPKIPWVILTIRDVDVFDGGRVRKWITKRPKSMSTSEIEQIAKAAERVLPARQVA